MTLPQFIVYYYSATLKRPESISPGRWLGMSTYLKRNPGTLWEICDRERDLSDAREFMEQYANRAK